MLVAPTCPPSLPQNIAHSREDLRELEQATVDQAKAHNVFPEMSNAAGSHYRKKESATAC